MWAPSGASPSGRRRCTAGNGFSCRQDQLLGAVCFAGPGLPHLAGGQRKPEGLVQERGREAAACIAQHSSQCQQPRGGRAEQVPVLHADTDDATALLNEEVHCLQAGQAVWMSTGQVWAQRSTQAPGLRHLSLTPVLGGLQLHLHHNDLHAKKLGLTDPQSSAKCLPLASCAQRP